MRFILISLLLLVAGISRADDFRTWDDGALVWSDFSGKSVMKTTPTYFKGVLKVRTVEQDKADGVFGNNPDFSTYALAVMDCGVSYADSTYRTSQMLRYHQLQFDILEYYRRRLQAELCYGVAGIEADTRCNYYQKLYNERIADIARKTVNGSNDYKLQEEEYLIRKQLEEFYRPKVTSLNPGKFSYGWYVGTGMLVPTSDLSDCFKNSWLFNIGLTFGYRRFFIKGDISYGQPDLVDIRKPLMGQQMEWATNKYTNQLSGIVAIGYRVLDTKHFSITPNIGGGWTNYAWDVADYKKNPEWDEKNPETEYIIASDIRKNKIHDFNFMVSVDFDWHFHSVISDKQAFLSGRREQYVSSLRLSPYLMKQKYDKLEGSPSGLQVGFTITYTGIARAIGIK